MGDELEKQETQIIKRLDFWFVEKRVGNHKLVYSKEYGGYQIFYNEYNNFKKESHRIFSKIKNIPKCKLNDFKEMVELYDNSEMLMI